MLSFFKSIIFYIICLLYSGGAQFTKVGLTPSDADPTVAKAGMEGEKAKIECNWR